MKKNYLRQISCLGRMALKWWLCLLLGGMLNLPATAQRSLHSAEVWSPGQPEG